MSEPGTLGSMEREDQPDSQTRPAVRESANTDGRAAVAIVALTLALIVFLVLRILGVL